MSKSDYMQECPESVSGHSAGGNVRGECDWCGKKITRAAPRPPSFEESQLSEAYGLYFDPDYEPYERDRTGQPLRRNDGEWS